MDLLSIISLGIQVSIFITVLSLGLQAKPQDLLHLFQRPAQLSKSVLAMYIIMPLIAVLVARYLKLDMLTNVILVALSVSPIPAAFPKSAFKSGADSSFTFGLMCALTLLSLIAMPAVFYILENFFNRPVNFSMKWLVVTLLKSIILAMALGMVIRYFAPQFALRISPPLQKIGGILLLIAFLPLVIILWPDIWTLVRSVTALALVLFVLAGAAIGYFLGGPDIKERMVLSLATATRHPGIAIPLAVANVDAEPKKVVMAAIVLYLIICIVLIAPWLKWLSKR